LFHVLTLPVIKILEWLLRSAKSEALQPRIIAEREIQRARREERRAYNFKRFEESRNVIDARRLERVAALEAASGDWITEQNVTEKIDHLLDSIFIAQEAADHARIGTPHEPRKSSAEL
jgi:urease gamma subunit